MIRRRSGAALLLVAAALVAAPGVAKADTDPAGCTEDLQYDPSIPTYNSVLGLPLGGGATGTTSRRVTADLQTYQHAVAVATQNNPRVRVIEKKMSDTALGRQVIYSVVSTPDNIDNLDAGRNDAKFWSDVREGNLSTDEGLAAVRDRPAFTWVTATPHGNEPAAGEASMRLLYEMAARLDCSNARRLHNLTTFIVPATNPDGRDLNQRATAWGFDPNRDRGTRVNMENDGFTAAIVKYPGVFVIDAHQQSNGYFFPPNEDAVHHEVSQFAIDFIQHDIGPMLQRMFNDQTVAYQNYNVYDLFAPIYGDSVPALLDGAAGMTYEKGSSENYGKQVYDHYLAMDATENITSDQKVEVLTGWVKQWGEAREQGDECLLQPNKLVSPLHTQVFVQPDTQVCGYYFPPGKSSGDTARMLHEFTTTGVHIYRTNADAIVYDAHNFGPTGSKAITLPKGTIWVPMAQGQKHWIQAILGENPYLPYPYNYDVTQWSYPLTRGIAGSGFLKAPLPPYVSLTEITDPGYGTVTGSGSPVYAFDTDSAQGARARDGAAVQGREGVPGGRAVQRVQPQVRDRRRARRRLVAGRDQPRLARRRAPDADLRTAALPGQPLRDAEAEDRPVLQQRDGARQPDPDRRRRQERMQRRLLRGAVRAHAEDEDPHGSDPADDDDRPRGRQARQRRLHGVHQPGHQHHQPGASWTRSRRSSTAAAATSATAPTARRRPATPG